ncbi:M10 family metallopeptidase C-terminal domain-containing protein [Neptunicoccus sediminis]|uniref:M10 family metallopeptidase C-terminal domain-containing protein n=1 Tax=Neptunicoccus sediminis TaxID=1892596 RepID=UPI000845C7E7|nr:M10 family metallopeptidase C-terminal domain-containing protein [Neptunicoccus sediminis]
MADFIGTEEDDGLVGGLFSDMIVGMEGNDLLAGLNGDDTLDAGAGDDVLIGGIGDDVMFGGSGNDKIVMTAGDDQVFGGGGNDKYFVNGYAGDWSLITDTSGIDTLNFAGGITGADIDLSPGALSYVDDRVIEISGLKDSERPLELVLLQDLSGSFSNDLVTVNGLVDDLITSVSGLADDVRLGLTSFIDKPLSPFGSFGDHEYKTELGLTSDTDVWKTAVTGLSTGSGNDGPESQMTGLLQVALRTAEVGWSSSSLKVVVLTTDARPHFAGDNPDTANNGDTVLDGPGGDGTGEDYPSVEMVKAALLDAGIIPVFAVTSDVTADYQALVDAFGFGTVVPLSSDSSDIIAAFEDGISGAADSLIENAIGTAHRDDIFGNSADNMIKGKAGNDKIRGAGGDDYLKGNKGKDKLDGGKGHDMLDGGADKDKLTGGAGADTFVFDVSHPDHSRDVVKDYEDGVDKIMVLNDTMLSFADIDVRQAGGKTILSHDGDDFALLKSTNSADIDATDFVFDIA